MARCTCCGKPKPIYVQSRRLCRSCYRSNWRAGTLDAPKKWPPRVNQDVGEGAPLDGVTYRQLDFWVRRGYLRPEHEAPGCGGNRKWTEEECRVARLMGRLVAAGFTPEIAHRIARDGADRVELAHGVIVEVS